VVVSHACKLILLVSVLFCMATAVPKFDFCCVNIMRLLQLLYVTCSEVHIVFNSPDQNLVLCGYEKEPVSDKQYKDPSNYAVTIIIIDTVLCT
jgi:hypothetical protein